MRRLSAVAAAATLGLTAGIASSATLNGTERADRLNGTGRADVIDGRGGHDVIAAGDGNDLVRAGGGRDVVRGGAGNDRIAVQLDNARDRVACGVGTDLVNAERFDTVAGDCELVLRQLSRDPYATFDGQHETQAEPHNAAWGRVVVAAFQVGRHEGGGADNIGWARSADGGRTWRSGILPSLTLLSRPAGAYELATDPVVAYDAAHRRWLIASLAFGPEGGVLVVSGSRDGLTWGAPVAVESPGEDPDKEWLACDNRSASSMYGRCYLAYMDFEANELRVRSTTDGGRSWSPAVTAPTGARRGLIVNGAQPVVRPNGDLVVVVSVFGAIVADENRVVAVRSADGGVTWQEPVTVSTLNEWPTVGVRAGSLTSVSMGGDGTLYAVWSDCRFRECEANDIVMSTSRDGVRWTEPALVRRPPFELAYDDYVLPAVAAAQSSRRVAVLFHALRAPTRCVGGCPLALEVWLAESVNGGATWGEPRRLSADPLVLDWLARSTLGAFVGDYAGLAYATGAPVPAFVLAAPPFAGELRQAVAAGRIAP